MPASRTKFIANNTCGACPQPTRLTKHLQCRLNKDRGAVVAEAILRRPHHISESGILLPGSTAGCLILKRHQHAEAEG